MFCFKCLWCHGLAHQAFRLTGVVYNRKRGVIRVTYLFHCFFHVTAERWECKSFWVRMCRPIRQLEDSSLVQSNVGNYASHPVSCSRRQWYISFTNSNSPYSLSAMTLNNLASSWEGVDFDLLPDRRKMGFWWKSKPRLSSLNFDLEKEKNVNFDLKFLSW